MEIETERRDKMKITRYKNCYCHICKKSFHYLGIARHRAMHRDKKEDCKITYTCGDTYIHTYTKLVRRGDES